MLPARHRLRRHAVAAPEPVFASAAPRARPRRRKRKRGLARGIGSRAPSSCRLTTSIMPYLHKTAALVYGVVVLVFTSAACGSPEAPVPATSEPIQATATPGSSDLQKMIDRFAPTDLAVDLSKRPDGDRRALAKLVEASRTIDALFLRQVWDGNEAMLLDLVRDESAEGRQRLHYFLINKGTWSRLDHDRPFVSGAPAKPEGANFYPLGAAKGVIEKWIDLMTADELVSANVEL